jgi:phosphatidate cytidylyltransferase
MTIFAVVAVLEFQKLTDNAKQSPIRIAARILDILITIVVCLTYAPAEECCFAIYAVARMILAIYDKNEDTLRAVLRSFFSVIYIAAPLCIVKYLNIYYYGLPLAMFIMIWLNDTGAYCVGSTLGKHRLCERLSPKKSWEGFFGGLIFCIAAGIVYNFINPLHMNIAQWIGMGIVVCLLSTFCDLFESLIKRTLHVKDSGNIIPGHGGILDRIDSLLFVAPGLLAYILLTQLL